MDYVEDEVIYDHGGLFEFTVSAEVGSQEFDPNGDCDVESTPEPPSFSDLSGK